MGKSKFNMSLLEPVEEENTNSGWNQSLLTPVEEEQQFLQPKQESFFDKLPRNIGIGLANLGHNTTNLPYDLAKQLQNASQPFGDFQKKNLPALQGTEKQQSYLDQMVNGFNKEHNVLEEMKNPNYGFNAENIPHQQEQNYEKIFGQNGSGTLMDTLLQKGIEYAPDIYVGSGLLKSGINKLTSKVGEKISNIKDYKKLQEKLGLMENKAKLAEQTAESSGLAAEKATKDIESLTKAPEISNYLNKGLAHETRGAKALQHRLGKIENYWKTGYKDLRNELDKSEFHMENIPEYENKMQGLLDDLELSYEEAQTSEISAELKSIISKAPTEKDIKASDFLTKYQDFRDARYDLLQRAKDAKTASERKALFQAYEDSKPIESAVKDALNEGLGAHRPEFERINKGYSEQVYPLRSNKVARKALSGKLGPNTIEDLAGNGEGQELMREIVKQDPELLRNIVGQRYAAKPNKIHELDENTAEYLSEMPEFSKMVDDNLNAINKKLEEVTKHKESKSISLKQKLDAEQEAKELKEKIRVITRDKIKIRKVIKRTGKGLGYGLLTLAGIKSAQQLLK